MLIITFSGFARNGKDYSAKFLREKLESQGKRCLTISYANYLKYICQQYFGWNGEKDQAGRSILQNTGQQVREKNVDYWVDTVIDFVEIFKDNYDFVLIPDTRYPNEIYTWTDRGYDIFTVHVNRPNFHNGLTDEQRNHSSETALNNWLFDHYIEAENLEELESEVSRFAEILRGEGYL